MDSLSNDLNNRIRSTEIVLQRLSNKQPYHDSLSIHFGRAMVYSDMNFHKGIYESIKTSGSQLINDEILRFEINNYYDYSISEMDEGFREIRDDFYNYMLTFLRQEFKYFKSSESKAEPRDFQSLKQNEVYQLSLGVFLDVRKMNMRTLNRTIKESSELMELINSRLEKIER